MLQTCQHKANKATVNDGALRIPVTMIVDGVMNGFRVPAATFAASVDQWAGRPVVVNHPEVDGEFASANRPDVPVVGRIYDPEVRGNTLAATLHIDPAALATEAGDAYVQALKAGAIAEVSTAYVCEASEEAGEFEGRTYNHVTHSIIPDHLALLTNDPGACSVEDGCGTNRMVAMMNKLMKKLTGNCNCEDNAMKLKDQVVELATNAELPAEEIARLQDFDEDQLKVIMAIAEHLLNKPAESEPTDPPADPAEPAMNEEAIANKVIERIARREKINKLAANEALSVEELEGASDALLDKLLATDYSGQNGGDYRVHQQADALTMPKGVLTETKQ